MWHICKNSTQLQLITHNSLPLVRLSYYNHKLRGAILYFELDRLLISNELYKICPMCKTHKADTLSNITAVCFISLEYYNVFIITFAICSG